MVGPDSALDYDVCLDLNVGLHSQISSFTSIQLLQLGQQARRRRGRRGQIADGVGNQWAVSRRRFPKSGNLGKSEHRLDSIEFLQNNGQFDC